MKMETEITVLVKSTYNDLKKELEKNGFQIKEEYELRDDYMVNNDIDLSKLSKLEILQNCILVRDIVNIKKELLYKYKKYTNISSKGKIMAKITGVEVDEEELRDFVNPFYVICTGVNPFTSKEENYRSENMWMDVRKIIEENNISELPVYIDENNNGNYRVDVTIIESKNVRSR